jgi:hypothetical protein
MGGRTGVGIQVATGGSFALDMVSRRRGMDAECEVRGLVVVEERRLRMRVCNKRWRGTRSRG